MNPISNKKKSMPFNQKHCAYIVKKLWIEEINISRIF